MVFPVTNKDVSVRHNLALYGFPGLKQGCFRSETLHSMVFPVTNKDVSVRHNRHTLEALELAVIGTPTAERLHEDSLSGEDLDSIISAVCHYDVTVFIYCHAPWKFEFS